MIEADGNQHHFDKRELEFVEKTSYSTGSFVALAAGDVDGDGNIDLVTYPSDFSILTLMVGNGLGQFTRAGDFAGSSLYKTRATGLVLADFNKDNNLDVVITNAYNGYGGSLSVLLGNGVGAFGVANATALDLVPNSIAAGDFNSDGNLDVVTTTTSDYASVILGDGTGRFGTPSNFAVPFQAISVAIADFNGDGHLDIATANVFSFDQSSLGSVSILLGDGTGALGAANTFVVGISPKSIAVGDFNNDGNLDIVTANYGNNTISLLLGDGSGSFAEASNFAVGPKPYSISVADFDEDGNLDIATANHVGNNISVLLGDGKGSFKKASNFGIAISPIPMILADINKDNRVDIVTAGNSSISTLINQSNVISTSSIASLAFSPSATNLNLTIPVSVAIKTTPTHSSSKTSKASPSSSGEPSTTPMSNGTLAFLMMAPVGGLLLLMLVFGAFFYRRYQNKIEKDEQCRDLAMLPMKRKSNDEKIELLVDYEEEHSTQIDAEMQGETTEADSQGHSLTQPSFKKLLFFKAVPTKEQVINDHSNEIEEHKNQRCIIS